MGMLAAVAQRRAWPDTGGVDLGWSGPPGAPEGAQARVGRPFDGGGGRWETRSSRCASAASAPLGCPLSRLLPRPPSPATRAAQQPPPAGPRDVAVALGSVGSVAATLRLSAAAAAPAAMPGSDVEIVMTPAGRWAHRMSWAHRGDGLTIGLEPGAPEGLQLLGVSLLSGEQEGPYECPTFFTEHQGLFASTSLLPGAPGAAPSLRICLSSAQQPAVRVRRGVGRWFFIVDGRVGSAPSSGTSRLLLEDADNVF